MKHWTKPLLAAALALGLAPAVCLATDYLSQSTSINAALDGAYLGKATVASPVEVLERKDGQAHVRISGWTLKEYPGQIFTAPGVRIENASIDEVGALKLGASKSQNVQGNDWVAASVEGWVPESKVTSDINALWTKAKARHADACSTCHAAPAADHFTANQWATLLPVKGGRAGHTRKGANELMFRYLQEHAKK